MRPKVTPVRKGPMDKFLKSGDHLEKSPGCSKPFTPTEPKMSAASCQPPVKPVKQEEEPHETHSFLWIGSDKTRTNLTCNKAGTVEDSLKRSPEFTKLADKNKNKELVILRDGKAISPHFPCYLIENQGCISVKYVKAGKERPSSENCAPAIRRRKCQSDKPVIFNVLTRGGENVRRIMKKQEIANKFEEITVFAYKGEKVRHALRRDNRLLSVIFNKNCALVEKGTDIKTEMLDLVDELDGKTVRIKKISESPPPVSPPESQEDAYVMQSEPQKSESVENQVPPQQSTTGESGDDGKTGEKAKQGGVIEPEKMPDSGKMMKHLRSEIKSLVKGRKTEVPTLSPIQNRFRLEFGKKTQTCNEVRTMKKLMVLSDSVCQVRINGRPNGTGFLLFDKFVLTNGHVIKNSINMSDGQLCEPVTVHFSFESLDQVDPGAKVEEVAGFEYGQDPSGHKYDWALLKLCADQELPCPLIQQFGFLPKGGAICIIGHPGSDVKKIDPCLIIPTDKCNKVVEEHHRNNPDGVFVEYNGVFQLVTSIFFQDVAQSVQSNRQTLSYESCFYYGSSGSPVFDEHCNVVAMHSGGYAYENKKREQNSVIEFGYPLSSILEHLIIQVVKRGRFDVLKAYLAAGFAQHQKVMSNVKKLVEGRNLVAFKNAINNLKTTDESLKMFCGFFSQEEELVPMHTD
ncbi:protein FAM111A-like [Xyrichtys novacula]|uniref:Protein FAM111A-like n=1 Tax=Xyrichtys novacula TaxID=13765 RepID=A0AAV1FSX0_XYRNO|nr:protein FAM111A-like [Xyrichtys novacula]